MTAEEMFRAKDFVPFFETPALFVYESFSERDIDRIDIAFYKYDKKFLVYYVDRDDPVEIDMPLLKAINKQYEEFGLLDELTIMDELIEKEKMGNLHTLLIQKKKTNS